MIRLSGLGRYAMGSVPLGYGNAPSLPPMPPKPIVFPIELVDWLAGKLGIRVFAGNVPQGLRSYPLIRTAVIKGEVPMTMGGPLGTGWITVQIDVFSEKYAEAATNFVKLRDLLSGYSGMIGRATCQGAFLNSRMVDGVWEQGGAGNNTGVFRSMMEVDFCVNDE